MNEIQEVEALKSNYNIIFEKSQVKPVKRCSSCGSVFISDDECESCGYQFRSEWVGAPLGANSLYSLREQYEEKQKWHEKHLSFIWTDESKLVQAYRRKLLKRFESLLMYVGAKDRDNLEEQNRLNLFLLELKDLTEEMMNSGVAYEKVVKLLKVCSDQLLVKSVYEWLHTVEHQRFNFSILDFLFYYRIFGAVRISFLFLFLGGVVLLSSLALAFY